MAGQAQRGGIIENRLGVQVGRSYIRTEVSILQTKGTNSEVSKLTTFKKHMFQFY